MPDFRPIGIFDSGLGGLTVVRAIREALPGESIVYVGDTARVPYGNKSAETVQEYSRQITEFLLSQDAKLIVVACNTASALALKYLHAQFDVPILGVIEPGVSAALKSTKNGHVGVIGTIATIASNAYQNGLLYARPDLVISARPCPLFVPLVEEGWLDGPIVEQIIKEYIQPIDASSIDTLVLGCTHYPLLKPALQSFVKNGTVLVDSASEVAASTTRLLTNKRLGSDGDQGNFKCYVTDLPARFESVASRFLGASIPAAQVIHL